MKIIGIIFLLFCSISSYTQDALREINRALEADSSKLVHGSVSIAMKGDDTLVVNKLETLFYIPVKEINSINYFTHTRYSELTFYARDDKRCIRYVNEGWNEFLPFIKLGLYSKSSANNLQVLFYKLYNELGLPIPNEYNARMQNDKQYEKWAIHYSQVFDAEKYIYQLGVDTNFTGYFSFTYPNGKLRCERNINNSLCDGVQKDYYENGQLSFTETYENGLRIAPSYGYSEKGLLVYKVSYKNGVEDGLTEVWFDDGVKNIEMFFEDGKPSWEKYWNPDGTLVSDINWKKMEEK